MPSRDRIDMYSSPLILVNKFKLSSKIFRDFFKSPFDKYKFPKSTFGR